MAELVLSDGTRSLDLIGTPPVGIYLVDFTPPIVARENTYAGGADSEGVERVRSQAQNATGSGRLRIDRYQGTAAAFWDDVDNLEDLIESAHRNKGTLRYLPPDGETVTFDLQSIRLSSIPQSARAPSLRRLEPEFEFECLPYGRLDAVTLETAEVITGPLDSFEVVIPGHVDGWCELTLTDTSTQNADHLEVGVDLNPTASAELFGITTLVTSGFGGASTTRAGSYNANVVRATLATVPITLCGTAALLHIGRKKIRARVYAEADGEVYVRLAYRVGDGPLKLCPWRRVPHFSDWYDVALDVIDIAEVPSGTHSWEGRIQVYAEMPGTLDLDILEVFPADVYARVGVAPMDVATATVFSARDEFDQTAGALTGKTLPIGGTWLGGGDASDLNVSGAGVATRTAVSDIAGVQNGRLMRASGTAGMIASVVSIEFMQSASPAVTSLAQGIILRYVDANNFMVVYYPSVSGSLYFVKRVAGVLTTLDTASFGPQVPDAWYRIVASVTASGILRATVTYLPGGTTATKTVTDAVMAQGGALASGYVGFVDWQSSATANTRTYDNFAAWVPEVDHALMSGQSAKFQHNAFIRENAAGTRYGKLPIEGHHLRIPPSTRSDFPRRVVVKRRRLNNDAGQPDLGLTDNATADLSVQPRVVLLGA